MTTARAPATRKSATARPINSITGERLALASPLFGLLPSDTRDQLARQSPTRTVPVGAFLMEHGAPDQDVLLLLAGSARVLNYSASGRFVSFATVSAGDVVGELAAIDGGGRSASVLAITPCTVAAIPGTAFLSAVLASPDAAHWMLQKLARTIRSGDSRISDLTFLTAEQRTCLFLLQWERQVSQHEAPLRPTPSIDVMASQIGVARETVARVLGRLTKEGIIERRGRLISIRNTKRLEELASDSDEA